MWLLFCSVQEKIWFEISHHGIPLFRNISLWNLPLAIWDRIWIEKTFRGLSSRISKYQKGWIFFVFAITVQRCVTFKLWIINMTNFIRYLKSFKNKRQNDFILMKIKLIVFERFENIFFNCTKTNFSDAINK